MKHSIEYEIYETLTADFRPWEDIIHIFIAESKNFFSESKNNMILFSELSLKQCYACYRLTSNQC